MSSLLLSGADDTDASEDRRYDDEEHDRLVRETIRRYGKSPAGTTQRLLKQFGLSDSVRNRSSSSSSQPQTRRRVGNTDRADTVTDTASTQNEQSPNTDTVADINTGNVAPTNSRSRSTSRKRSQRSVARSTAQPTRQDGEVLNNSADVTSNSSVNASDSNGMSATDLRQLLLEILTPSHRSSTLPPAMCNGDVPDIHEYLNVNHRARGNPRAQGHAQANRIIADDYEDINYNNDNDMRTMEERVASILSVSRTLNFPFMQKTSQGNWK